MSGYWLENWITQSCLNLSRTIITMHAHLQMTKQGVGKGLLLGEVFVDCGKH